eukprot:scaffold15316_cov105-Isochrysis_galbana.AAC.1
MYLEHLVELARRYLGGGLLLFTVDPDDDAKLARGTLSVGASKYGDQARRRHVNVWRCRGGLFGGRHPRLSSILFVAPSRPIWFSFRMIAPSSPTPSRPIYLSPSPRSPPSFPLPSTLQLLTAVDSCDVPGDAWAAQRPHNPIGRSPFFCAELWVGWFSHWGEPLRPHLASQVGSAPRVLRYTQNGRGAPRRPTLRQKGAHPGGLYLNIPRQKGAPRRICT